MKLKKFKERNNKQIGIILFTITCILLVSGVILYRTFAIFEVKTNQNIMNGQVEKPGDIQFMVYVEDKLTKEIPKKELGYTLDTSKSKCENGSLITWNDTKWSIEIKNISTTRTKCFLYFDKIYVENELNGAIPNLENGRLIPVIFKENGKVLKADITDTEDPWYKYADQKWANAVILRDGKTDEYIPGDEILESDIESYFVWIPRYKYQLKKSEEEWNKNVNGIEKGSYEIVESFYQAIDGNKGATEVFNIEFETKDKGNTQGGKQGEYLTHPAFLSFDSNGFWVGKFETGYNQNSDDKNVTPTSDWSFAGAEINEENSAKVIIKPNVYSWRNIQVANAFYTSYNYKRDLESHMMKNMEWGAVAFLTQSKYGRCINNSCTRVRINNDSYHRTGYSAVKDPTCGYTETNEVCNQYGISGDIVNSYDNLASVASSTTNNYYGVFDMAGGSWEYVMGVMQVKADVATPTSGRSSTYNSGFKGPYSCPTCDNDPSSDSENKEGKPWPSSKYYDLYDYGATNQNYYRGKMGDGTKEFGPIYNISYNNGTTKKNVGSYNANEAFFVAYHVPWFMRGGNYNDGTNAGTAAFSSNFGQENGAFSFRIVLTP